MIALSGILVAAVAWVPLFGPHRPYVNWAPWDLAEYLAERKRPARECLDLIWFEILSPTAAEQRQLCIYTYASLTKDPTACELLLPSDYGWSCFGGISGPLFSGRPCILFDDGELYCNEIFGEGELRMQNPNFTNCGTYGRTDVKDACHLERTANLPSIHECNLISNVVMYDRCEFEYSIKEKSPSLCEVIKNDNRRSYCQFYVQMVVKYRK